MVRLFHAYFPTRTLLLCMSELLLDTPLDSMQRDYAESIRDSGNALLTVINDILDFSKVEAGKLELEQIDMDLRDTLDNKDATADTITQKLTALRDARTKAQTELQSAQKDLKDVLTQRQEASLVMMGILE